MTDHLPLLTFFPYVLGGVLLVSAILLYFALRNADDGSEDENGFHRR